MDPLLLRLVELWFLHRMSRLGYSLEEQRHIWRNEIEPALAAGALSFSDLISSETESSTCLRAGRAAARLSCEERW